MKFPTCLLLSATFLATPAWAEPLKLKPIIDTRLRYESVDQDPMVKDADALTFRARIGAEMANKKWSFLIEGEATAAIVEHYNSGVNLKTQFPIVADPENVELNRAQVQYKGLAKTVITLGRQRINLDDQRFVGAVGWRQNEQTFDAVRIENSAIKNLKLDVTYAWSDRTIWGVDGFGTNQQAISGDNVFANVSYKTKIGTLTGFAYLVDQDEFAVAGFRRSSQSYGARFAGSYPLSKAVKLTYAASYATQSDYHRNPNDYKAEYYLIEGGLSYKALTLGAGYEVLGADEGVAFTSFQTPLATLHKFQGWADKFLTTPPNGIKDLYGSAGYTLTKVGPFASIAATLVYHDYKTDRLDFDYGSEWNLQLAGKIDKFTLLLKYADYNAKTNVGFVNPTTDTKKFWASVEWAF
ncbi:MAG TPA: alginate export family protein [Allosphingosinicella sp.]|nr:alginate export family protein [Allosphingosinicella sp.]